MKTTKILIGTGLLTLFVFSIPFLLRSEDSETKNFAQIQLEYQLKIKELEIDSLVSITKSLKERAEVLERKYIEVLQEFTFQKDAYRAKQNEYNTLESKYNILKSQGNQAQELTKYKGEDTRNSDQNPSSIYQNVDNSVTNSRFHLGNKRIIQYEQPFSSKFYDPIPNCLELQKIFRTGIALDYLSNPVALKGYGLQIGAFNSVCNALNQMESLSKILHKDRLYILAKISQSKKVKLFYIVYDDFMDENTARFFKDEIRKTDIRLNKIFVINYSEYLWE